MMFAWGSTESSLEREREGERKNKITIPKNPQKFFIFMDDKSVECNFHVEISNKNKQN